MTMAEGSDPMGNVGHRHQHGTSGGGTGVNSGVDQHINHPLFVNHNVAWKQRKRKRLSAVLDKLHNNNNNSATNSTSPNMTTTDDSQVMRIKAEDLQMHNESRGTPPTESSEDDKSEVYSAPGSSPRITISPLRLAELDDSLNNNNNNNNNSSVMNKNTLFSYPPNSHLLMSQMSPGVHIKNEFPSPPYHRYLPMASPLYYLQSRYLPELLKRRNSNSDSEHALSEENVPKSRDEKRKREKDDRAATVVGDVPLDLSMKAMCSMNGSPLHCQKENVAFDQPYMDDGGEGGRYRNGSVGAAPQDEATPDVGKDKRRRSSSAHKVNSNNSNCNFSNNNSYQQYNYQQQHYLTQQHLLATQQQFQHHPQLHLEFLQNHQQQLADQHSPHQFLAKLSTPSPSSWSPPIPQNIQGRQKSVAAEKRAASKAAKANKAVAYQMDNNNTDMGSLNINISRTSLLANMNMMPSGSVGVPIVKGDVASPTTKESVASRYNLDVLPVVEEMPPGSDVAYVCPVCGQMFSLHDRLAKHMASRHKSKSASNNDITKAYGCDVCKRSFARSDMLTRHMRLHTGVKPYTCKVCGQVFSRSDHLSTHQRTHTGEKPYKCPQCPYAACRRDMITRHMRTHTRFEGQQSSPRGGPSPAAFAAAAAAAAAAGMHSFGSIKMEPLMSGMGGMLDGSPPISPANSMSASPPPPPPTLSIVKTESAA